MGYSILIKESVLLKALSGRKTQHEIATEFGVGKSTIQNWLRYYRNNGDINLKSKEKHPKDWAPEGRISASIETGAMTWYEIFFQPKKTGLIEQLTKKYDIISLTDSTQHTRRIIP